MNGAQVKPSHFAQLRIVEAVIAVALALLVGLSIGSAWGALPNPYRWFSPPTKEKVCVQVMWVSKERAAELCKGGGACWFPSSAGGHDLIVAQKPRDFNDEWALMILGHELLHAFGASHD